MNYVLYGLISILIYVLINKYMFHKRNCIHKHITVFTDTTDNIPLNYSFTTVNGGNKPLAKNVYLAFIRCTKCGHEKVIISDGGRTEFHFNEAIYIAYCRDIEKKYDFKKELNI